jgi:hypothetical protein
MVAVLLLGAVTVEVEVFEPLGYLYGERCLTCYNQWTSANLDGSLGGLCLGGRGEAKKAKTA